jgi:hypothetical protein
MKWTYISIGLGLLALAGFRLGMRDPAPIAEQADASPAAEIVPDVAIAVEAPVSAESSAADQPVAELLQLDAAPHSTPAAIDHRLFSRAGPHTTKEHRPPPVSP